MSKMNANHFSHGYYSPGLCLHMNFLHMFEDDLDGLHIMKGNSCASESH